MIDLKNLILFNRRIILPIFTISQIFIFMKSLFNTSAFAEIEERLEKLNAETQREWGKMDAAQMLHHCQGPLNIMLGINHYGFKSNWLAKVFFKKYLYNDKPWSKNLPTAKALKVKAPKNFDAEKTVLKELMGKLYVQREKEEWEPHPGFGYFTKEQWGQMQYKHLDHHLKQFGL